MKVNELLDELDQVFQSEGATELKEGEIKEPLLSRAGKLVTKFFRTAIGAPIHFVSSFIKNELVHSIQKDAKHLFYLFAVGTVFLLFLSVFWLSTVAYFVVYSVDHFDWTYLKAISYAILIQAIVLLILFAITFRIYKTFKTKKLIKRIGNSSIT